MGAVAVALLVFFRENGGGSDWSEGIVAWRDRSDQPPRMRPWVTPRTGANEKMNLDTARVITSDTRRETTVKRHNCPHARARRQPESEDSNGRCGWFLRTWFVVNSMVAGLLAVIWLILRSGPKPSRLAYPCQQAAFSAASLAFAAPLISALIAARRGLVQGCGLRLRWRRLSWV